MGMTTISAISVVENVVDGAEGRIVVVIPVVEGKAVVEP